MEKNKKLFKIIGIVAGVIGFISSIIGIFVFVTGKRLPEIIPTDAGTKTTVFTFPPDPEVKTTAIISSTEEAVSAKYPAGINEGRPRVVDGANLLSDGQIGILDERARDIIKRYNMDIVIVTQRGLGGSTPMEFADDFFDYYGYGWREIATDDIATGSGILLLVEMNEYDLWISTAGAGISVFHDRVVEQIIQAITPELGRGEYYAAFMHFLSEVKRCLED